MMPGAEFEALELFDRRARPYKTLPDGDTTPSVRGWGHFHLTQSGATTITALEHGVPGQRLVLIATDGNTTIQDQSSGSNIYLVGAADRNLAANEIVVLEFDGTNWYEV